MILLYQQVAASLPPELPDNEGLYRKIARLSGDADAGIELASHLAIPGT